MCVLLYTLPGKGSTPPEQQYWRWHWHPGLTMANSKSLQKCEQKRVLFLLQSTGNSKEMSHPPSWSPSFLLCPFTPVTYKLVSWKTDLKAQRAENACLLPFMYVLTAGDVCSESDMPFLGVKIVWGLGVPAETGYHTRLINSFLCLSRWCLEFNKHHLCDLELYPGGGYGFVLLT